MRQIDEPGLHDVESRDKLMTQAMELIKNAKFMGMGCVDAQGTLKLASIGVPYEELSSMLRSFADHIDRDAEKIKEQTKRRVIQECIENLPADRRGKCPGCAETVVLTKPIPPTILQRREGNTPICVCTCGAFLAPWLDDAQTLQLRFLTIEEVAELPDEMRNQLIRARNKLEHYREQRDSE